MFKILFIILIIILFFILIMSGVIIRIYRMFKPKENKESKPPHIKQEKKQIKKDDGRIIDVDFEEIK